MARSGDPCRGPLSRRSFLKLCSLGLGGCGLTRALQMRAEAREAGRSVPDTSVILVWLPGGPPHMETFDMKPDAPEEYRGAFRPIHTNVPGIDICEHLPRLAGVADRYSIIRSVAHRFSDHGGGHKHFLTGRDPREPTGFVNDHPMVGSMVAKCREGMHDDLPGYVTGVDNGRQGIDVFSFGSAYLGAATHPFILAGDPSSDRFQVRSLSMAQGTEGRLQDRLRLLRGFDSLPTAIDQTGSMAARDDFTRRAVQLVSSDRALRAFDLQRESDRVRERYGMHAYGQRALLARRLVEAGCSFVTMVMENPNQPAPKDTTYNWDSHAVNCHIFVDTRFKLGFLDQAISALVEDLHLRGLDRKVMLIVTGEFGRTPRVSYANDRPGRDHWPQAMSMLVSGGGMRMGQVVGSTNARGEHPKDRPLTPNDLWATMFHHLGIDPHGTSFLDHTGRPMPILPYGETIGELL